MQQIGSTAYKALGLIDAMTDTPPPPNLTLLQGGNHNISSFRKRSDGRWEGRFYVNGKQISVYADTKKDCKAQLKNKNNYPAVNDITLAQWIEKWLILYKIPKLQPNSIASIKQTLNKYVLPKLGDIYLNQLDPIIIQELINGIKSDRQKEITARNLNNALAKAYKLKLIRDNPVSAVEFNKAKSDSWHALTKDEEQKLLTAIEGTPIKWLVMFYLCSGCRRNEALALTWKDIDFSNNTILINKSYSREGSGTTKNKESRTIPLTDSIKKILSHMNKKSSRVFPISPEYVQKCFKQITVELGFDHIVIHSLRHTFATRCLEAGVNIKVVSSWLGHKQFKMTTDLYTHVQEEMSKKEAEKINFQLPTDIF